MARKPGKKQKENIVIEPIQTQKYRRAMHPTTEKVVFVIIFNIVLPHIY